MSDFAVVVPAVDEAARRCRAAGADLADELATLRREADAVLSGEWRGLASRAFEHDWGLWLTGAHEVIAALDRLAEVLTMTACAYAARDESSALDFQRVAS